MGEDPAVAYGATPTYNATAGSSLTYSAPVAYETPGAFGAPFPGLTQAYSQPARTFSSQSYSTVNYGAPPSIYAPSAYGGAVSSNVGVQGYGVAPQTYLYGAPQAYPEMAYQTPQQQQQQAYDAYYNQFGQMYDLSGGATVQAQMAQQQQPMYFGLQTGAYDVTGQQANVAQQHQMAAYAQQYQTPSLMPKAIGLGGSLSYTPPVPTLNPMQAPTSLSYTPTGTYEQSGFTFTAPNAYAPQNGVYNQQNGGYAQGTSGPETPMTPTATNSAQATKPADREGDFPNAESMLVYAGAGPSQGLPKDANTTPRQQRVTKVTKKKSKTGCC